MTQFTWWYFLHSGCSGYSYSAIAQLCLDILVGVWQILSVCKSSIVQWWTIRTIGNFQTHFIPVCRPIRLPIRQPQKYRRSTESFVISFPYLPKFLRFSGRTVHKNSRFLPNLLPSHKTKLYRSISSWRRRHFLLCYVNVSRLSGFPVSGSRRAD